MSYVDALYTKESDEITVVERVNGERIFKQFKANYVFYYKDDRGSHKTIFGDTVKKFSTFSNKAFTREKAMMRGRPIFESDINPVFRCLSENYLNVEAPTLNLCFFDIEVSMQVHAYDDQHVVRIRKTQNKLESTCNVHELSNWRNEDSHEVYDKEQQSWVLPRVSCYLKPGRGFAPTDDPFNNITAISLYLSWLNQLITLVMPPPGMTIEVAQAICEKYENCILFESEAEMLDTFLNLIADMDVISGWNSTGFDIPYMVNRITRVLGKDENRRWNLWNQQVKRREYFKFKKKSVTYDLVGRVHLDYLELYQKHNPQQLHSYRLDFVGEIETGENKIAYQGTLDDLYKKDFSKFIEYNRQDTMLLVKIDKKKKFIELANQIAHTNTVLLKTTMGSVALIEQAITNYAHSNGMVIPDRKPKVDAREYDDDGELIESQDDEEDEKTAVGAYVAKPKAGIRDMIGCIDINSLYPSTLRALNMSPETLVGHIRPDMTDKMISDRIAAKVPKPELWEGVFCTVEFDQIRERTNEALVVDFEDGTSRKMRASELNDYIYHQGRSLSLSANGTLFKTDQEGIIPGLLDEWYTQRQQMQAREKTWVALSTGGIDLGELTGLQ